MFCVLMGRVGRSGRELPCNSSLIHIHLGVFLFSLRHQPLCPQPATHPPLWSHKWVKSYHDDRLLYTSIWDARSPESRKAVLVFARKCWLLATVSPAFSSNSSLSKHSCFHLNQLTVLLSLKTPRAPTRTSTTPSYCDP